MRNKLFGLCLLLALTAATLAAGVSSAAQSTPAPLLKAGGGVGSPAGCFLRNCHYTSQGYVCCDNCCLINGMLSCQTCPS